jgi:hypothetical protein
VFGGTAFGSAPRRGHDSPWYPTLRLFRQRQRVEWDAVAARVRAALMQRLSQAKV